MRTGGFHGGGMRVAGGPRPSHPIAGRPIAGRPGRPIAGYPGGYYAGYGCRGAAAAAGWYGYYNKLL
jgi:hypothetical protein